MASPGLLPVLLPTVIRYLPSLVDGIVGGALGNESLGRYLRLGTAIVANGVDVELRLRELDGQIAVMVREGREPNDGEWSALEAREQAAVDRLTALVEMKRAAERSE